MRYGLKLVPDCVLAFASCSVHVSHFLLYSLGTWFSEVAFVPITYLLPVLPFFTFMLFLSFHSWGGTMYVERMMCCAVLDVGLSVFVVDGASCLLPP